ncbi:MAG TPA: hypothetical protein VGO58_18610 [Chitinophagaceae bacterium]|nr:hypothetical protein [Chitinophagaceae bacterium]
MPNTQTDSLFLMVRSLTRAEKRHFKLYAARNQSTEDAKFIRLFEVLDTIKEYNEETVLKKVKTIKPAQLANVKAHLYGQLLVSLRLLHSSKNTDTQIREQIDFAKILYNRGLVLQSLKILDKAKTLATGNSHYILVLEILQFEKAIESQHITRSIKGRADDLVEQTQYILNQVSEVSRLSNISLLMYGLYLDNGHIRNENDSKETEKFFKEKLGNIQERQVSFFGKAYLHQAYCWYYFIQLDFARYYRHADKWVNLFSDNDQTIRQEPFLYLKGMHNLLNALFMTGMQARMIEELEKLEKFYQYSIVINENLHTQAFVYLYTAKLNQHFLEGTFKEGLAIIPGIERKLVHHTNYIDIHRVMIFYYKIACLYFGAGDNEKAIVYLHKIISLKVGNLRSDIQCFARLLHLIAHYELGNTTILEYLIKSVYRFLSKMEYLDAVQNEIFKFLRRSLSSRQQDIRKNFIDLRDRLEKVASNKYARRSYQYLDIVSWLESKIEKKPVEEIIQKKFKQRG